MATTAEHHGSSANQYAWLRTRYAIERTLMAWGRTGTALIGFGFTIGEFLSRLNSESTDSAFVEPPRFPELPVILGLALIAVGTLGLAFACFEYSKIVHHLRAQTDDAVAVPGVPTYTPTLTACYAIVVVGAITFFAVLLRRL